MSPSDDPQRDFALEVVQRLRAAGHEALWAGGCVRDQLLGRRPKDYDVATSALPETVRDLFGRRRTLAIGVAFGVITVRGPKGIAPVEVATFRTDGKYLDGRRPESVAFTDARHDAQRRDFTINGLFFDPVKSEVVDHVSGVADLAARIVRAIGDPRQRFEEDKLRMLRAVRFAATFDFALDQTTLAAVRNMADEVTAVSGERIGAELRRILTDAHRRRGVELLAEVGLVRPLLPELAPHVSADDAAWQQSLVRLAALHEPSLTLALAALLYGMIEPDVTRAIGARLRLPNRETARIKWLVEQLPAMLQADQLPWPQLQRLLAHEGGAELVALLSASVPDDHPGLALCRLQLDLPADQWNPPPLVSGDDLLTAGYKSGKRFAALLEHLRDLQLEGRLRAREEALAEAARWWRAPATGRLD